MQLCRSANTIENFCNCWQIEAVVKLYLHLQLHVRANGKKNLCMICMSSFILEWGKLNVEEVEASQVKSEKEKKEWTGQTAETRCGFSEIT